MLVERIQVNPSTMDSTWDGISIITLGSGQYRNAVASVVGSCLNSLRISDARDDPTLPRYGTDRLQARFLTFEAKPCR